MKLFLIWAAPYSQLERLINRIKESGHEIPYWVGLYENDMVPDLSGTIFHDHYDAWVGEPAKGLNASEFPPPGKELIEKMYKTESLVLTMMNKKFNTITVDERRHIYYNMLSYWNGLINKYKPEAIVFPAFPHTVYNFIVFNLAKLHGIKTVMFDVPWVSDRLLMYNDWQEGSKKLLEVLKKNTGRNYSESDLSADINEYYMMQSDREKGVEPIYTTRFKEKFWGRKNEFLNKAKLVVSSIKDGSIVKKTMRYVGKRFKTNLTEEYQQVQVMPDWSKDFIYVPLAFQPEASTCPLGDMFVDQVLMIETLSYVLPKEWVIYVKEHPAQWWMRMGVNFSSDRYQGYYRRIAALKNVRLIPVKTDSFSLIDKSRAVAVVTGTTGWEAIMRSKPALIFGYPWYRDYEALFRVCDTLTCNDALTKIAKGYKPERQQLVNYLRSFDEASFHGYFEVIQGTKPKLSREKSMQNIIDIILGELT